MQEGNAQTEQHKTLENHDVFTWDIFLNSLARLRNCWPTTGVNSLSANSTKWSNTHKQFGQQHHFVGLAIIKGLNMLFENLLFFFSVKLLNSSRCNASPGKKGGMKNYSFRARFQKLGGLTISGDWILRGARPS